MYPLHMTLDKPVPGACSKLSNGLSTLRFVVAVGGGRRVAKDILYRLQSGLVASHVRHPPESE